jgi:FAD/FMN-containing dehydrogenase
VFLRAFSRASRNYVRLYTRTVLQARQRLRDRGFDETSGVVVTGYGHLGDSNLHLNVSSPHFNADIESTLEPWLYETVGGAPHSGSVSAEHGIGVLKTAYVPLSKPPAAIAAAQAVKDVGSAFCLLSFCFCDTFTSA